MTMSNLCIFLISSISQQFKRYKYPSFCWRWNHSVFEQVKLNIPTDISNMKLFLCILLITLASAHEPKDHFDYTKCCKIDKSPATNQYVDEMVKLADECKPELGKFPIQIRFPFKWIIIDLRCNLQGNQKKENRPDMCASTNASEIKRTS